MSFGWLTELSGNRNTVNDGMEVMKRFVAMGGDQPEVSFVCLFSISFRDLD